MNRRLAKRIFINRVPFEVIGVLEERGQGLDATNEDNQVYVPLSTAMRRLANVDYFSSILFAVTSWDKMDETTEAIHQVLGKRHRAPGNLPEDFQIQNQKALIDTEIASSNRLTFLVRWVGLSGLAVSGLGYSRDLLDRRRRKSRRNRNTQSARSDEVGHLLSILI